MEKPKPEIAYTTIVTKKGWTIGLAERDVAGWAPMRHPVFYETEAEAREEVKHMNERLGVGEREAHEIVISSVAAQNRRDEYAEQARKRLGLE